MKIRPLALLSASSFVLMAATSAPQWDGKLLTGKHLVVMHTSKGDMTLELDADIAPKTVTNFITLAKAGYYDDLTFHRVIPDFMIQGGDPTGTGAGGESIYGEKFEDEFENNNPMLRGALAMANAGPNTNGSQFFIVQMEHADWLEGKHTVFGRVIEGMGILDVIAKVPRDSRDKPMTPVTFSVEVKSGKTTLRQNAIERRKARLAKQKQK